MKYLLALAALFASFSTAALADGYSGGASAGANAGASASANVNTEGSVGVSTPGGANPCAVGGGLGVPGVAGISLTLNGISCVVSNESDDIRRHCESGMTLGCLHLARNNRRIRGTLEAAGMIPSEMPARASSRSTLSAGASAPSATSFSWSQSGSSIRIVIDGKSRYIRNQAAVAAFLAGNRVVLPNGVIVSQSGVTEG